MKPLLRCYLLLLSLIGVAQAIPLFNITTATKEITLAPGATAMVTYTIENRINANISSMQYIPPTLTSKSGGTCGTTLNQGSNCTVVLILRVPDSAPSSGRVLLDPLRVCGIQRNLVCSVANQTNRVQLNISNLVKVSGVVTQALPSNLSEGSSASFSMTYTNGAQGVATGVFVALPTETGLTINSNSCGTASNRVTLPISGSCVVTATYTPPVDTSGLRSFTTTLSYGQGADVALTTSTMVQNIAVSGAVTQVLPNNLAEGNSASFSMTYTNGTQGIATGVFAALPTETGLTINSNSCGTASNRVTLPISGSCVVTATYTPPVDTSGLRSFTTTLSYGQGADVALTTSTMVQNIAVSGAVTQVLPNNLAEGNSTSFSMTYTNGTQGIATGVFAALPTETGLTINSNSCGTASNRVTLPISGSCVVTATYTPPVDTSGLRSFTTTLSYGQGADVALTTSTMVQNIAVSGAVTQVLPNNLAEGNSASFSMTYTNGTQGIATGVFAALPTETGLTINSNSCGTASNRVTLPISGSCVVTAIYTPPVDTSGLRSFTTTLSYGQGADVALTTSTMVQNIAVSGAVTQVLPNNLAEGNSASFSMTYTNGAQGVATGVFAALPTETGLTINSNSCGTASNRVTLPISGSCVVTATYTPPIGTSSLRSFTTTLSYGQGADVALTTSTMVQNIAVSGAVTQVLPNNLAEGNSASFSMTYTNGAQGVATGVFAALPTETGLTINSNSCGTASNRVTLPISGSCVVTATYTPPIGTSSLRSFTTTLSYGQGADVALTTSTMVQNIAVSGAVTQVLPNNLAEGNSASFSMTYTNGAQGIATGVFAALPTETGLTINSNSCGTASNRVTLPISGSCVVTATYTPPIGTSGLRSFTTTLSYGQGADVALTTSTMVQNIAVSGAVTQVLPNNLAEGNSASFSMTYTNGAQGVATGVFAALPTETGLTINSNSCGTASNRVTLPISGKLCSNSHLYAPC